MLVSYRYAVLSWEEVWRAFVLSIAVLGPQSGKRQSNGPLHRCRCWEFARTLKEEVTIDASVRGLILKTDEGEAKVVASERALGRVEGSC